MSTPLICPLTDPTAFGGRAEEAFDVVIPSLPGYGFSAPPAEAGWGSERIGRAWDVDRGVVVIDAPPPLPNV